VFNENNAFTALLVVFDEITFEKYFHPLTEPLISLEYLAEEDKGTAALSVNFNVTVSPIL
jgi:hypothetical protein